MRMFFESFPRLKFVFVIYSRKELAENNSTSINFIQPKNVFISFKFLECLTSI